MKGGSLAFTAPFSQVAKQTHKLSALHRHKHAHSKTLQALRPSRGDDRSRLYSSPSLRLPNKHTNSSLSRLFSKVRSCLIFVVVVLLYSSNPVSMHSRECD